MVSVNDPSDFKRGYQNQLARLADLESTADADAILVWANSLSQAYSTRENRVKNVRLAAERAAAIDLPPLTEWTSAADYFRLQSRLESGDHPDPYVPDDGLSAGSLRNVRQSLRLFFRDGLGVDWWEDLKVGAPERTSVTADDIYDADDVAAMFAAITHPMDLAYCALVLATGQRRSAALSLRIGDVKLGSVGGKFYLNDEALGLKGAAGFRLLTWATPYVRNWIASHPRRSDPAAPLFCTTQSGKDHDGNAYSIGDPLSPSSLDGRLDRIAARAGLTRPDGSPKPLRSHAMRHTAVTQMVYDGVKDQRIKWMVGWGSDSTQFERYLHLKDEEMAEGFLDDAGYEPDMTAPRRPTRERCPNCNGELHGLVNPAACPSCGLPLTVPAGELRADAEAIEERVTDAAFDPAVNTDDETRAGLAAMRAAVTDRERFAAAAAEAEARLSGDDE